MNCFSQKQEWSLDDLKDVMVWVTSAANQAGQKCFCLVILCSMKEVEKVADMVVEYTLYPSVHKAYYHVENTTSSKCILSS